MYTLYYSPGSCSMAIHIMLNECGQPVKLEKVDLAGARSPEFLKLNPRGAVPVLVDDGMPIREGAAQIIHILEKHESPLLPASEPARTKALQALMFCNATLHPAYARIFFLKRNGPDDATKKALMDVAIKMVNKMWGEVEEHLAAHGPYFCGKDVTAADILVSVIANWNKNVPGEITFGPKTKELFKAISARPAFKKALETETVEYRAAA